MKRPGAIGFAALVASAGIAMSVVAAVPAHAVYPPDPSCLALDVCIVPTTTTVPIDVLGKDITRVRTVAVGGNGLPVTGGDLLGLVVLGSAAALGGGVMVRLSRRDRNT